MNLQNHRAIMFIAAKRAMARAGSGAKVDLLKNFWALHQGSWLTDMCQVTAFFDMAEGRKDPYSVLDGGGVYVVPKTVQKHQTEWANLFRTLWKKECEWAHPSFRLGEPDSLASAFGPQLIGGYHPYDHFDVVNRVDAKGNLSLSEAHEFEDPDNTRMIKTARDGLFSYVLETRFFSPFSTGKDRHDRIRLKMLGHGLHTLQDFFAHSNFVELLLSIAAKNDSLDTLLCKALLAESYGTYASCWIADKTLPEATPVMTGRFDRIDTIATLLKILREGLIPPWNDLAAAGYASNKTPPRDLLFEVMFGTFSENPFTSQMLKLLISAGQVVTAVSSFKDTVLRGVIEIFAAVGKLFSKSPEIDGAITEVKDLLQTATTAPAAATYAKAGRILYLERVIEAKLRTDIENAKGPILPHHTLLAKDKDPSHPEVRLAYNLANVLAVEITTEVLYLYAIGADHSQVEALMRQYFQHPETLLSTKHQLTGQLQKATSALYGERWAFFAESNEMKVLHDHQNA